MFLHTDLTDIVVRHLPFDIRQLLVTDGPDVCVAGGFVRDTLTYNVPHDVDIFAVDVDSLDAAIDWYEWHAEIRAKLTTPNAVTFRSPGQPTVQFISRCFYPDHEKLIESFDFSVCQAAVYWNGEKWIGVCTEAFLHDITNSELTYTAPVRDEDPGASVIRLVKFALKGYAPGEEDVVKCVGRFFDQLSGAADGTEKVQNAFRRVHWRGSETLGVQE